MKEKRNSILSGWLAMAAGCSAFLFIVLVMAGSAQAAKTVAQPAEAFAAAPTATPTKSPTGTPASGLAVLAGGFDAWCVPQAYALQKPTG
ncbi:MAG: hypothetical protein EHM21_04610, partial [Chloroflexi bacterium]